jgi:hypothetical protein
MYAKPAVWEVGEEPYPFQASRKVLFRIVAKGNPTTHTLLKIKFAL